MSVRRLLFVAIGAAVRASGAGLQSAPTLIMVDQLYVAPFGPQLEQELDATVHNWHSDFFPAELQARAGYRPNGSKIHAARIPRSRLPPGDLS